MLKKLVCLLLTVIMVLSLSISVFADPTAGGPAVTPSATPSAEEKARAEEAAKLGKVIDSESEETEEIFVDITRPDDVNTLSLTKSTYVITGVVKSKDYTDVTVVLQVYDEDTGDYIPLENTDGESRWEIGSFGMFSKEIKLKEGPNQIRLLIYRSSQFDNLTAEDVQIDKFTITLLKSGVKEIFNKAVEITKEILKKIEIAK